MTRLYDHALVFLILLLACVALALGVVDDAQELRGKAGR